mmetsp:Transcript_66248/g.131349  ORF Transcript_66248/g.131349 Transcript_66248/m.131349 type:complete len:226 (+) Transcript_66248:67-744(+)
MHGTQRCSPQLHQRPLMPTPSFDAIAPCVPLFSPTHVRSLPACHPGSRCVAVLLLDALSYRQRAEEHAPHLKAQRTLFAHVAVFRLLAQGRCRLPENISCLGTDHRAVKLWHRAALPHVEAYHGRCGVEPELLGRLEDASLAHVNGAIGQVALCPQLDVPMRGARHMTVHRCWRNMHDHLPPTKEGRPPVHLRSCTTAERPLTLRGGGGGGGGLSPSGPGLQLGG